MFSFLNATPSNQNNPKNLQLMDLLELSQKERHLRQLCVQSMRLYRRARRERMIAFKVYMNALPNRDMSPRTAA